jgi:hypothetical protein
MDLSGSPLASGLIIPTSSSLHRRAPKYVCRVPTADGGTCGHPFYEGEERARERHVAECCKRNHDAIVAFREKQHPDVLRPWDPELERWIAEHRDEVLEGRKSI